MDEEAQKAPPASPKGRGNMRGVRRRNDSVLNIIHILIAEEIHFSHRGEIPACTACRDRIVEKHIPF